MSTEKNRNEHMEKIVSLCKRKGFIFQSAEIYGGLNGCWDYGPLGAELKRNLKNYWWQKNVVERDDSVYAPLFASHGRGKGTAITPGHAWLLVKNAARAEGLYANTSPHSLRHRRAQDLLDEGMPLEWVSALLGHEHPDTTRIVYAWQTDEERLADMVKTYGLSLAEAQRSARTGEE